jgi:hypothetical protein
VILHDAAGLESDARAADLPLTQALIPGGMFLGWLLENQLCDPGTVRVSLAHEFVARERTGPQLFAELSGRLEARHLGEHALRFARTYLRNTYLYDFAEQFPVPGPVHVFDTWDNYEWIRITLVARYSEWRSTCD